MFLGPVGFLTHEEHQSFPWRVAGHEGLTSVLSKEDLEAAHWPLDRPPYLLETSLPGVFAAGDVRCGNMKRVASAAGEGSMAVAFVHRALREM